MNQRKNKLRPSQDVVQRLRWDPRFEPAGFWIGYRERGGGEGEASLPSFLASPVPWSRVVRVRREDGEVVWDRARRVDRLFGSGETAAQDRVRELLEEGALATLPVEDDGFLIPCSPWRWQQGEWRRVALAASEGPAPAALRALTWNVLFDRFKADRIRSAERTPALLAQLGASGADLIGLQEVTPRFLAALLAEPWARDYWLSEGPPAGTVTPHGLLLLSRRPLRALGVHAFSAHKQAIVAELADAELSVAVLHLTSNMMPHAPETRAQQLRSLRRYLERSHGGRDWLLLGDFNQGEGEPDGGLGKSGARDLWSQLRPSEPGHTFAPARNDLAALMSSTGVGARFDRVLLRSRRDAWQPAAIELLGTEPIAPLLWPSDHFGVAAELTPRGGLDARPVHTSALVALPPLPLWARVQEHRLEHDEQVRRWPPHVNLLYGFLPAEHFPAAAARLGPLLAREAPFELRLPRLRHFQHRRKATAWLEPECEPAGRLAQLQARLAEAFPQCDEQGRKSQAGFTPHLSVGRIRTRKAEELAATLAAWREELSELAGSSAEVDALYLIARQGERPFRVTHALPLGPPRSLGVTLEAAGLLPPAEEEERRRAALARVEQVCAAELGGAAPTLRALGSSALGVTLRGSDLDLALDAGGRAGAAARALLERLAPALRGRVVLAGGEPLLRAELEGVALDLQTRGSAGPGWEEPAALRAALPAERWPEFQAALRGLKAWARLRGVDQQAFGWPGGAAWAAALAWVAGQERWGSAGELLAASFAALSELGPQDRLAASGPAPAEPTKQGAPWIGSAADPALDLAGGLRSSTWAALQVELRVSRPLAEAAARGRGAWSGLFLPRPPATSPALWLTLEVEEGRRAEAQGWVQGVAQALIGRLEEAGCAPRPSPQPEPDFARGGWRWAFELRRPPAAQVLDRLDAWLTRARPPARASLAVER